MKPKDLKLKTITGKDPDDLDANFEKFRQNLDNLFKQVVHFTQPLVIQPTTQTNYKLVLLVWYGEREL